MRTTGSGVLAAKQFGGWRGEQNRVVFIPANDGLGSVIAETLWTNPELLPY